MKRILIIMSVCLVLVGSVVLSFVQYSMSFYNNAILPPHSIEGIVVLTGGKGRLSKALELFTSSQAKFLYIAGVKEATSLEAIFTETELEGVNRSQIILEKTSKTTHENALYARDYMIQNQAGSIVLLTSVYHMKRAAYIFSRVFPANIEIYSYAIESQNFSLEDWWKNPNSLRIAFTEFLKYGWYLLFL